MVFQVQNNENSEDKIIVDLLERVKILEQKVDELNNIIAFQQPDSNIKTKQTSKKYRYLADFLFNSNLSVIRLSFSDIESIIKCRLPMSAYLHRAFWANTTTHSIALSWLNVGYETTDVKLNNQLIVFEKKRSY